MTTPKSLRMPKINLSDNKRAKGQVSQSIKKMVGTKSPSQKSTRISSNILNKTEFARPQANSLHVNKNGGSKIKQTINSKNIEFGNGGTMVQ